MMHITIPGAYPPGNQQPCRTCGTCPTCGNRPAPYPPPPFQVPNGVDWTWRPQPYLPSRITWGSGMVTTSDRTVFTGTDIVGASGGQLINASNAIGARW